MNDLPNQSGTYALILKISRPRWLQIGRLGRFDLSSGFYVYLGSACGPGGIKARLGRHLRLGGKPHWHIDYLRSESEVCGYGYLLYEQDVELKIPMECRWSQVLASQPSSSIPIPKFGASDCKSGCPAHVFHFVENPTLEELKIPIQNHW